MSKFFHFISFLALRLRYILLSLLGVVFLAALPLQIMGPGLRSPQAIGPYLNGIFPNAVPTGGTAGGPSSVSYSLVNAFPNLTFKDPVDMAELPGGNEFLMVGLQGHVWKFANDPNTSSKQLLLDVSYNTLVNTDGGMLGIVLHPEYGQLGSPNRDYIYLFYRYTPDPTLDGDFSGAAARGYMRLSRFSYPAGATSINPSSEFVLMQIYDRHDWHNGGDMFFGPNGFLYLVVGDEGAAYDSYGVTQQIDKWLFGGVLRLDVDQRGGSISHPIRRQPLNAGTPPAGWPNSFTQGYYIPNDNPWLDPAGGILEEFYAIGTRSPHRMTYDSPTGDIWIGDIGQSSREEISIVRKGDNLQWPYREGNVNGRRAKPNPLIGKDKDPIHAYGRSVGRSVTGGFVYRGGRYPELNGKYFFGDHETQNVWTLTRTGTNSGTVDFLLNVPVNGAGSKDGISSFYVDSDEYIYILDLFGTNRDGGMVHRLQRQGGTPDPPEKLSDLGVFTNLQNLTPAPGIIPYDVNAPLWSDRAKKSRWIALPNDGNHNTAAEQITFDTEENWKFPKGTVMIKHFDLPTDERNPGQTIKLETRFVVFTDEGDAYGVTYKWNSAGSEAFLVGLNDAPTEDFLITRADGTTFTQTWEYPSRQQCMQCHNSVAGFSLGIKTRQLNKDFTYPSTGIRGNQLETWDHLNMFDKSIGSPTKLPALAYIEDATASEEMRVRSYIDGNCSYCHRPNGVEGVFDGRSLKALFDQNMVSEKVISHASPSGWDVVHPGNPAQSVLYVRDGSNATDRMPPLGRTMTDDSYLATLASWINQLDTNGPETITDGWYSLQVRHSQKYLAIRGASMAEDAQAVQTTANDQNEHKWYFQEMGNRKYRILTGHSNQVLSVRTLQTSREGPVIQENWNGGQHQLWYLEDTDNGYYRIKNAYNNLELNVHGGRTTEGRWIITWTNSTGGNQQWKLSPTDAPIGGTPTPAPNTPGCDPEVIQLSSLDWVSATTGWGTIRKNTNLRGGTMAINGKTYTHGIATHANSDIVYNLGGEFAAFTSDIGVDNTAPTTSAASVQFEVLGDGNRLYISPVMRAADDAISINVDVSGVQTLLLRVHELPAQSPARDPDSNDHADWAAASLEKYPSVQLSSLDWVSATTGWGTIQKNTNLRGGIMAINGKTYTHGIATHANSDIVYDLGGAYQSFISDIGVDNTAPTSSPASVQFEVLGDGNRLYLSPVMGSADDAISINVNVSGVQSLTLRVLELPAQSPARDPDAYDHSDWAGPRLIEACCTPSQANLSALDWKSASTGWGTIRKNTNLRGGTMAINAKTYTHGIATHANSEIVYELNGAYGSFSSDIGVDNTAPSSSPASVQFEVQGDGRQLYISPIMRAADDALSIKVDVNGVQELKLLVHELPGQSPARDPDAYDHSNWAGAVLETSCCTQVESQLSRLNWESATTGWGTIRKNTNLRGGTMAINAKTYTHGISTHANSDIVYRLDGKYQRFTSDIGVDNTAPTSSPASVQFEVLGDGNRLYLSPVMRAADDAITIDLDVVGVNLLTLRVDELPAQSPARDPDNNDHADWAAATLIGCDQAVAVQSLAKASEMQWIELKAEPESHLVKLDWEVEHEESIDIFRIERSVDGIIFGIISEQAGLKSSDHSSYSGMDENPVIGQTYYRITAIGENNEQIHSHTLEVGFVNPEATVLVYPNPIAVGRILTADIRAESAEKLNLELYGADGKLYMSRTSEMSSHQIFEQFKTDQLSPGIYFLRVNGANWSQTRQILIRP
ncbi:MAG: NPCBM/NEW2 domain-containing protein [Bacteroidota bacterium]